MSKRHIDKDTQALFLLLLPCEDDGVEPSSAPEVAAKPCSSFVVSKGIKPRRMFMPV
jgi:hypothetical protein